MARLEDAGPHLVDEDEPVDHAAMAERMSLGQRIHKVLAATAAGEREGAKAGFGDAPLGLTPGSENSQFLAKLGLKYEPGFASSPLTALYDPAVRGIAAAGDLTMRAVNAAIYAGAGAAGHFTEESGLLSPGMSRRLTRDAVELSNAAMIVTGMNPNPLSRIRHAPDGRVIQEDVGALPTRGDFADVGEALARRGHVDSPEHLSLSEFRAAAAKGVIGPAEPHVTAEYQASAGKPFERIDRGFGVTPGMSEGEAVQVLNNVTTRRSNMGAIDAGIQLGYRTEDIAAHEAHAYAIRNDVDFLGRVREAIRENKPWPKPPEAMVEAAYDDMIARSQANPAALREKLQQLYEETGVHPNEVLADAKADPALHTELASDSPTLPARYTGVDPRALQEAQRALIENSGARAPLIEGISHDLNLALETRTIWPQTVTDLADMSGRATPSMRFGDWIGRQLDRFGMGDVARDLQMKITPMAERNATIEARAAAKDFANSLRVARWDGQNLDRLLSGEFTPDRLRAMWEAADLESVALQTGKPSTDLASLSTTERAVVKKLQARAVQAWEDAKKAGVVSETAKPLPSYVPRMVINAMDDVLQKSRALDQPGHNLRTTTKNLKRREYLTVEETEAAAKTALGEDAEVLRDIRTLNLATTKLNEAIAGRTLVNNIKALGEDLGQELVSTSAKPDFFTIDHPSLKQWGMQIGPDGKPIINNMGEPVLNKQPIHIHNDFEGPLRATLTKPDGAAYSMLMELKAKATTLIMYSPLLHNAVIFARVLPATSLEAAPKGLQHVPVLGHTAAAVRMYFTGNAVKNNAVLMRQAIGDGVVPIGRNGARFDITSIAETPQTAPGRSTTSQILAAIPDLYDPRAGDAVRRTVDRMGDFWHNTLLWERVGDLQMGVWDHYRTSLVRDGYDVQTAGRLAAHLANRYTGALPPEAMSAMARKIANVTMFSRSFTLGNLGAMKDMFVGIPRDVAAQITRDQGFQALANTRSMMQRKALGIVAMDAALFYAGNSVFQSALEVLLTDKTLGDEGRDYVDRFFKTVERKMSNPYEALNPFGWMRDLSSNSQNEPGKEDRVFVGYQSDGTAIYAKNPLGKTGEEMVGWMTHPGKMVDNKLSTLVKPLKEIQANKDFKDKEIYNPYPHTAEDQVKNIFAMVWHFMKAQAPTDPVEAAWDLVAGTPTPDEKTIDTTRLVGPLFGIMFSSGAPGGPAIGELMRAKQEKRFKIDQAMPGIRKDIKEDRLDEAVEKMNQLEIPPKLQKFYIETTLDPAARINKRAMKELLNSLPEEHQERIRTHIERSGR